MNPIVKKLIEGLPDQLNTGTYKPVDTQFSKVAGNKSWHAVAIRELEAGVRYKLRLHKTKATNPAPDYIWVQDRNGTEYFVYYSCKELLEDPYIRLQLRQPYRGKLEGADLDHTKLYALPCGAVFIAVAGGVQQYVRGSFSLASSDTTCTLSKAPVVDPFDPFDL